MTENTKPLQKPNNPNFSSGPCAKRPGWTLDCLKDAALGRSHRAKIGKEKLKQVIDLSKDILQMPDDYVLGIVPASDTGAFEMALWSMLGPKGVDVFSWESFSQGWDGDINKHLKIDDVRSYKAGYGEIADLAQADPARDCVFAWNGTTSGVRVADGDWIANDREGLTFCDATSAVFAMNMPWEKLDVVTWSWQKVLGGEAAHGMIALSPRAVERLESFTPEGRPLPKIFRLTKGGKLIDGIFEGATINTPSMLAVEDCLDALNWVQEIGGLKATIDRSEVNAKTLSDWVDGTDWIANLCDEPKYRSNTSVCLKIVDPWFTALNEDTQQALIKSLVKLLDSEGAAYDLGAYRDAPAGLRIWCGATVEAEDVAALCPWLEWAYAEIKAEQAAKAA